MEKQQCFSIAKEKIIRQILKMSNTAMMFMLKKLGFEMSNVIEVIDENETEITRHAMSHWYIYKLWERGRDATNI